MLTESIVSTRSPRLEEIGHAEIGDRINAEKLTAIPAHVQP